MRRKSPAPDTRYAGIDTICYKIGMWSKGRSNRRDVLRTAAGGAALLALPPVLVPSRVMARERTIRIAIIDWHDGAPLEPAFFARLEGLGYGVAYDRFNADFDPGRAIQIMRDKVLAAAPAYDFVLTIGTAGTVAVRQALERLMPVETIDHLFISAAPVAAGIVPRESGSGGALNGGWYWVRPRALFDLLEAVAAIRRVAVPFNPREMQSAYVVDEIARVGSARGLDVLPVRYRADRVDFALAMDALGQTTEADALIWLPEIWSAGNADLIGAAALRLGVPSIATQPEMVVAGVPLGAVPSWARLGRGLADHVDQVMRGIDIGTLPLVVDRTPRLLVNSASMAALDLTLPERLQQRAEIVAGI